MYASVCLHVLYISYIYHVSMTSYWGIFVYLCVYVHVCILSMYYDWPDIWICVHIYMRKKYSSVGWCDVYWHTCARIHAHALFMRTHYSCARIIHAHALFVHTRGSCTRAWSARAHYTNVQSACENVDNAYMHSRIRTKSNHANVCIIYVYISYIHTYIHVYHSRDCA